MTLLQTLQTYNVDVVLLAIHDYLLRQPADVVRRLRSSLDSPRFADCRSVIDFIAHYNLPLKPSEAHEFVMLPPGTYTHNTLPYGPSRLGIRRGDIVYLATESHGVVEVHMSNLSCVLDSVTPYRGSGKPPTPTGLKVIVRRGQPCTTPALGDRIKDCFGCKFTVDSENIARLTELAKVLDYVYIK